MELIGIVGVVGAILALVTWAFEAVWNAVLPDLFGWHTLTFWQAAGIIFLLSFIGNVVKSKKND